MLSPEDRWEIADLLSRYCFAADSRDFALFDTVFTEDVRCIFQTGDREGRAEVVEFMAGVLASLTATQHNLTSSVVTGDGDEATGTTHLIVQHLRVGAENGETFMMGGTYYDNLRKTAAGWRIQRRELRGSWRTGNAGVIQVVSLTGRPLPLPSI